MLAALAALVVFGMSPSTARAQDPTGAPPPGAQAPAPVIVGELQVRGNERLADEVIQAETNIQPGDTIFYWDVQDAIRRLWATGQYRDVKVYAAGGDKGSDAPVTLVVEVDEHPVVAEVEFRGLENVSAGTVKDTVGLTANGPYRPSRVAETEHMIRNLLADKGIQLRSIEHRLEEIPDRPGERRLVFDVREGHRVAITDVAFEGNEAFTDEELRDALDTKSEGFLWYRTGTYKEDQLETDLRDNLPLFYGRHGYIDFTVTGDTLIVDPETGKARLVIRVDEGPQYELAGFDIEGNSRFSTEDLRQYFEQNRGGLLAGLGFGGGATSKDGAAVFDQEAFQQATQEVQKLYSNSGYLYAQVEPVVERTETEDGEPAVRVAWRVREGEPAYVNRVTIEGNTYTHEDVIREQILLLPGDVYSEDALLQSYQRIMALGFFETPLPMPEIEPTEDGDVNITFKVKEKQTGSINFGTAIGGWAGLSGFLGYDQPNLFGQAKAGHLRWEFGRYINNFEASYSDPGILGSRVSGSASLFSTRGNRYYRFRGGTYRRTGGSLRFGFPLPVDRYTRFSMGYSLSQTDYQAAEGSNDAELFRLPESLLSTVSVGLTRQTLNHPMFPTAGTRHSIQAEFNGGPLGGDGNFQKYNVSGKWYVPVGQIGGDKPGSRPIRFTLGLSADAGAIFGDRSSLALFPFERYWMGGVQFGEPLRGYDETTITPRGYVPEGGLPLTERFGDAYLRLSAEYAVRFNDNLSVSLFYDAGNVWNQPSEINPTQLLRGAGLGVTVVTPFGPLGLDWAYGFDRDNPGWKLHFKLGPTF